MVLLRYEYPQTLTFNEKGQSIDPAEQGVLPRAISFASPLVIFPEMSWRHVWSSSTGRPHQTFHGVDKREQSRACISKGQLHKTSAQNHQP